MNIRVSLIGSELTRQIVALEPAAIGLLDISEYQLYEIDAEVEHGRAPADPDRDRRDGVAQRAPLRVPSRLQSTTGERERGERARDRRGQNVPRLGSLTR